MNNLAAAVELVAKWCRESSEWKADKRKQLIPSHFDLGRIKALDQCSAELETILAELGRGAGEVTDERIQRASALAADLLDESERIAKLGNESSAFVYRSIAKALTAAIGRGDGNL